MDPPRATGGGRARALFLALGLCAAQSVACYVSLDGLTGGGPDAGGGAVLPSSGASFGSNEDAGAAVEQDGGSSIASPDASPNGATTPTSAPDATPGVGGAQDDAASGSGDAVTLALGAPTTSSPTIGGDSGAPFSETCPDGAALVGLNLVVDTDDPFPLLQVAPLCSQVAVARSGVLTFSSPLPLALEGEGAADEAAGSLLCPLGSVVVGMSANAEKYVHSLALQCQLLVAAANEEGFTIGLGPGAQVGPFGGSGGDPIPAFQCPPPSVANALSGSAGGDGYLDSLVVGCATPSSP